MAEKEIDEFVPGLLAKIVVIQGRWRELYNDLQEYPNLIQDLERHFQAEMKKPEVEQARQSILDKAEIQPQEAAIAGDVGEEKTGTPTLLQKYAAIKPLGKMLMLPPDFESLKIDQIQPYLYLTHTVVAEAETKEETFNVDQRRWEDLLSNDPTKVRAAAEAIQTDGQAKSYAPSLLNVISGKKEFPTQQRVSAGNALGYLGDPRLREDAWYLPDDPMLGFVEIPEGKFLMGSDPKRGQYAQDDGQPQHEVTLPTYYIARYPVTVAQFQAFVKTSGYKPADENSLRGVPNHPVIRVSWYDAVAYCDWLSDALKNWKDAPQVLAEKLRANQWHITLPSEAEWEKGARGIDGRIYPWGNKFDPDKANTHEVGLGTTSAVGCFPAGAGPYGVLDMSGNVWEWTRSLWGKKAETPDFKYPYVSADGRENLNAPNDVLRVVRGGSFYHFKGYARGVPLQVLSCLSWRLSGFSSDGCSWALLILIL